MSEGESYVKVRLFHIFPKYVNVGMHIGGIKEQCRLRVRQLGMRMNFKLDRLLFCSLILGCAKTIPFENFERSEFCYYSVERWVTFKGFSLRCRGTGTCDSKYIIIYGNSRLLVVVFCVIIKAMCR